MALVYNAWEWKKWWSMRFIIATAFFSSISGAYVLLPADWMPDIAGWIKQLLALGAILTAGAAGVSRVLVQPKLSDGGG